MTEYWEWQSILVLLVATDVAKLGNHHVLLKGAEKGYVLYLYQLGCSPVYL